MTAYRLKRRNFIHAVGGGLGLKVLLGSLEAAAQTNKSPPRLLVTHWPLGAVATGFAPTAAGSLSSPILQPFVDAGLGGDMTVLRGVRVDQLAPTGTGGHGGLVRVMTGVDSTGAAGTASGPSFDQIFLKNVPALGAPNGGTGYASSTCDSRVDVTEQSSSGLSYGYSTSPPARPILPTLSPLQQWTNLFQNFVPTSTGGTAGPSAMLKQLVGRKSVLDFTLGELARMRVMAPASSRDNIDIHTQAIRNVESQLASSIKSASGSTDGGALDAGSPACATKPAQPSGPGVMGGLSGSPGTQYADAGQGATDESVLLAQVGHLHLEIFKAAFICDLIRVGTFQWAPPTDLVAFGGLMPGSNGNYQHYPTSQQIGHSECIANPLGTIAQFLANVQTWFNQQHAANLKTWKTALDGRGNSLLDSTVVPYVTEVEDCALGWTNIAAMIIGGKALGFNHGIFASNPYSINQFWGTVGQAFGYTNVGPVGAPIGGLWTAPI